MVKFYRGECLGSPYTGFGGVEYVKSKASRSHATKLFYTFGALEKNHFVSCLSLADIDECQTNNGGCQHRCINTNGSHQCACNKGHFLNADKVKCEGAQ